MAGSVGVRGHVGQAARSETDWYQIWQAHQFQNWVCSLPVLGMPCSTRGDVGSFEADHYEPAEQRQGPLKMKGVCSLKSGSE